MAKKSYNMTVGGVRCYYDIYIADGKSIEFLITFCYEKLAELLARNTKPWLERGAALQGITRVLERRSQKMSYKLLWHATMPLTRLKTRQELLPR